MAFSFGYWFRSAPVSSSIASSADNFSHAYRGSAGSPVIPVGANEQRPTAGGVRLGGSSRAGKATTAAAASAVGLGGDVAPLLSGVVLVGGGSAAGGAIATSVAFAAVGSGGARLGGSSGSSGTTAAPASFLYWRRGASVSSSAQSASGHFEHAYRGQLGLPFVHPWLSSSFLAAASGGVHTGGAATVSVPRWEVAAGGTRLGGATACLITHSVSMTGGGRLGGSATDSVTHLAVASGGAGLSGSAATAASYQLLGTGGIRSGGLAGYGLSTDCSTGGGWGLGGGSVASLSAVASNTGGATFGGGSLLAGAGFHIYVNDGQGGPINYASPVDTVYGTTWTSDVLSAPSSYRFGVRAYAVDPYQEESNLDASVRLELDADGVDVTWAPLPPIGVRAFSLAGGRVRVEWTHVTTDRRRRPNGFNVYAQAGVLSDYTTPAAVAPYATDLSGTYAVEIGPLADGASFAVGVRSYNAIGEEHNFNSVRVDADASPPSPLDSLLATPIARAR